MLGWFEFGFRVTNSIQYNFSTMHVRTELLKKHSLLLLMIMSRQLMRRIFAGAPLSTSHSAMRTDLVSWNNSLYLVFSCVEFTSTLVFTSILICNSLPGRSRINSLSDPKCSQLDRSRGQSPDPSPRHALFSHWRIRYRTTLQLRKMPRIVLKS